MPRCNFFQRRFLLTANSLAELAAALEGAALRQIKRAGYFALQRLNFFAGFKVNLKHCLHQRFGVRVHAFGANPAPAADVFNHVAKVHNGNLMAHQIDKADIVADKKVSNVLFLLQTHSHTFSCTDTSSALVASSHTTIFGSSESARAIPRR